MSEFENDIPTRVIAPTEKPEDGYQATLRPKTLQQYIGQERLKDHISLAISAAKRRLEPLDHVLLHGPPGLGKTTLARTYQIEDNPRATRKIKNPFVRVLKSGCSKRNNR